MRQSGEKVVYSKYAGTELKMANTEFVLLKVSALACEQIASPLERTDGTSLAPFLCLFLTSGLRCMLWPGCKVMCYCFGAHPGGRCHWHPHLRQHR